MQRWQKPLKASLTPDFIRHLSNITSGAILFRPHGSKPTRRVSEALCLLTSSDCDFFIILTWFLCLHHGWGGYSVKWFLLCLWNMIRSLHRCFILKMYQILYTVPVWLPVWFDLCSLTQLASEINYLRILRGAERRAASETRHVMTGGIPSRMVAISSGGIINHFILDTLAVLTISCSSYSFMFKKFNPTLTITLVFL